MNTIILLFIANALAHLISFYFQKKNKDDKAMGVFAFAIVNALIALFLWQGMFWAKWAALIFPFVGGLALLLNTLLKKKGIWIDYIILILDIAILSILIFKLF